MEANPSNSAKRRLKIENYLITIEKIGFGALLGIGCMFALSVSLTSILSVIVLLAFVAGNKFRQAVEHIKTNSVFLLAAILFLVLTIGILYTSAPLKEAILVLKKYRDLIFILICASFIKTERHRELMINAFSCGMLVIITVATVDWLGWAAFFTEQKMIKDFLLRVASNSFMVFFAFLALHKSQQSSIRNIKLLWLLAAVCGGFYVYVLAYSRTAYLLGLLLVLLWAYQKLKIKGLLVGAAIGAVLVASLWQFSPVFHNRINEAVIHAKEYFYAPPSQHFEPTQLRIGWYTHSFKIFTKKPIFGHGTGSMLTEYKRHFPNKPEFLTDNAHNSYLLLGVQVGVIGILLYIILLICQWRFARFLPGVSRSLAEGFVLVQGIGSLANSYLLSADTGLFYCYFTVLLYTGLKDKAARNRSQG